MERVGHEGVRAVVDRLRDAFESLPSPPPAGQLAELCRAAAWLDRLHEFRYQIGELTEQEHGRGAVTYAAGGYWFAAHQRFLSGEWEAAGSAAEAGLELCVRHGLDLLAQDLRCCLGWIAAARGDDERTRAYSTTVEQWARPRDSGLHLALSARNLALAALTRGDFETAYAECVRVSPPGRLEPHRSYAPWMVLDLVESALQTGRTEEARAPCRRGRAGGGHAPAAAAGPRRAGHGRRGGGRRGTVRGGAGAAGRRAVALRPRTGPAGLRRPAPAPPAARRRTARAATRRRPLRTARRGGLAAPRRAGAARRRSHHGPHAGRRRGAADRAAARSRPAGRLGPEQQGDRRPALCHHGRWAPTCTGSSRSWASPRAPRCATRWTL